MILGSSRKNCPNLKVLYRMYSSASDISIKEVKIPTSYGFIAGKLWESAPHSDSSKNCQNPPTICMHGWLDNSSSFDTILPLIIKPNMKVFAPDLPGHGRSSHFVTSHYNFAMEGLLTIQRVREHFSWDRIGIIGHSMGSIISFLYTSVFPENVTSFVGFDNFHPGAYSFTRMMRGNSKAIAKIEQKLAMKLPPPVYTLNEILEKVIKSRKNTVSEEGCKILLNRGAIQLKPNEDQYSFTHDLKVTVTTPGAVTVEQAQDMAKAITCPVCVIIKKEPGDDYSRRQDLFDIVDMMKKRGQAVQFHQVPGTHHFHLDEPKISAEIINKFLF